MKFSFLICLLMLSISAPAAAAAFQNTGLELIVVDQSGAVIPNVTARLKKDDGSGSSGAAAAAAAAAQEITAAVPRTIVFSGLAPGRYQLEIEAPGFKTFAGALEIKAGIVQKTFTLEIAQIVENVVVAQSNRDKNLDPGSGAFTNFLTRAELAALPDDPELMKKALKRKFGDDAEFLVDGFTSQGLPRKEQIASIKVSQSSFDAEHHKIGIAIIEITTKPTSKFFGFLNLDFNGAQLNARQAFAPVRSPAQDLSFGALVWGPLKKDKASFLIAASESGSYQTSPVTARLPGGDFVNSQRSPRRELQLEGKLTYNLSQFQTSNLAYSYNRTGARNLGIGGFNLPERGFNLNSQGEQLRYSQVGNVGQKYYNEFRAQYADESSRLAAVSRAPTVIVLDAFSAGGAGNDLVTRQRSFSVADNFLWGIKNHALKIGGVIDYARRATTSAENQEGTFTFSSLADYEAHQPAVFTQNLGSRQVEIAQLQLGAFIQDDVRVSKSLMLNLGLRYERQNNLDSADNFSPRLGFAWSPKENGKTTVRGGVGVFYNWLDSATLAAVLSQDARQPGRAIIIDPDFASPFAGGTSQILPRNYWQKAAGLKNPYIFLAQLGVQRQLTEKSSLRAQYSYQKGTHLFRSRDINAPLGGVRPAPDFGQIIQLESSALLFRQALKIDYNTAPTKKTFLSLNYVLAKTIADAAGAFGLPSDNYNLRLDRAVTDEDQRHSLNGTFGWALPRGLRFSTIFRAGSPLPYTITTGRDDNGDTIFNDRPANFRRNSARGSWQRQFDTSLSWQYNLGKHSGDTARLSDPNAQVLKGKTLIVDVTSMNVFNQTNFQNFVGVQTSPFFGQPTAAAEPRQVKLSLKFSF